MGRHEPTGAGLSFREGGPRPKVKLFAVGSSQPMDRWNRAAHLFTHVAGSKRFFGVVFVALAGWLAEGLIVGTSRGWELTVSCGVPILTLLMVVVLQHAQNRDTKATHIKLNELLLALEAPDSSVIRAGQLSDGDLADQMDDYHSRA